MESHRVCEGINRHPIGGVHEFNVSILDLKARLLGKEGIFLPVPLFYRWVCQRIICPKSLRKFMVKLEVEIRSPYIQLNTLPLHPKIPWNREGW